jgi:hypothetical protein
MIMIKIPSFKIICATCIFSLFIFGQIHLVSAATVKMLQVMPAPGNTVIGERVEYILSGDGMGGLGSMEITVHFPAGSLVNPQVVFDNSFHGDTAAAQVNTTLPGTIGIGIIDATGFSTPSGEIARISFEISEKTSQDVKFSADLNITDLQGKRVDSSIFIEPAELHIEKSEEIKEDTLTEDSTPMPLALPSLTTHNSEISFSKGIGDNEGVGTQNQKKLDALCTLSESGDTVFSSDEHLGAIEQESEVYPGTNKQSQLKKAQASTPNNGYKIKRILKNDQLYEVSVDLSEKNLNFGLSNGEIIGIVKTNGIAKLRIKAGKRCMLYLISNKIAKIPII